MTLVKYTAQFAAPFMSAGARLTVKGLGKKLFPKTRKLIKSATTGRIAKKATTALTLGGAALGVVNGLQGISGKDRFTVVGQDGSHRNIRAYDKLQALDKATKKGLVGGKAFRSKDEADDAVIYRESLNK